MGKNKKKIILIVILSIFICGAVTYGAFFTVRKQTDENKIASGCFSTSFTDGESINLTNGYAMSDADGKKTKPYEFTLTNTCSLNSKYYVILSVKTGSFSDSYINLTYNDGEVVTLSNATTNALYPVETGYTNSYIIGEGNLANGSSVTNNVRLWINGGTTYANVSGKTWEAQIKVVSSVKNDLAKDTLLALGLTSKTEKVDFHSMSPGIVSHDNGFTGETLTSTLLPRNPSNYLVYADSYEFNPKYAKYTLINPKYGKWSDIYSSLSGKYVAVLLGTNVEPTNISLLQRSIDRSDIYQIQSETTVSELKYKKSNTTIEYQKEGDYAGDYVYDFSDTGIYPLEDDYGTSYYFRGAVENNYVKFGKWNDWYIGYNSDASAFDYYKNLSECESANIYNKDCTSIKGKDMYWRIIRINGSGSIRLIYDGTTAYENNLYEKYSDRQLGYLRYNPGTSGTMGNTYIGYMYGDINGTTYDAVHANSASGYIKTFLDEWYESNFVNGNYNKYISDEIFCNDRSLFSGSGVGSEYTEYSWYQRFTYKTPSLKCPQKHDAFTVNDTVHGNGNLTYPIGLITADELLVAGVNTDGDYYNYQNYIVRGENRFWTMTPYNNISTSMSIAIMSGSGTLSNAYGFDSTNGGVVPVINLSAETAKSLIGTGTITDPFRLK